MYIDSISLRVQGRHRPGGESAEIDAEKHLRVLGGDQCRGLWFRSGLSEERRLQVAR
jgi:hypothetical protein